MEGVDQEVLDVAVAGEEIQSGWEVWTALARVLQGAGASRSETEIYSDVREGGPWVISREEGEEEGGHVWGERMGEVVEVKGAAGHQQQAKAGWAYVL